jgi:carbon storage regulator
MLLIRRHAGQSIRIGDEIEICIAELSPTRVTLGICAPRQVPVIRSELALTERQNIAAADSLTAEALVKLAGGLRLVP